MARPAQHATDARRTAPRGARLRPPDVVTVLSRTVREVQTAVDAGRVTTSVLTRVQAVALVLRQERERLRSGAAGASAAGAGPGGEGRRSEHLKRLDGVATSLAVVAVRDPALLVLLSEDAVVTPAARALAGELMVAAGVEPVALAPAPAPASAVPERRVVPPSVVSRQLANPFLPPDYALAAEPTAHARRLAGWDLVSPLLRSFERAGAGEPACMALPEPSSRHAPAGLELMRHQAQVVAAADQGHRTFLLADEPGLGKTAQALLAAEAARAHPLLVVVPNVVKTSWAREAARWVPHRSATVVQGDGERVDGFADVVVVNYDVLDRHAGWLGDHGFRGMVVDEAHFIKNRTSQRSRSVLEIARRIRARTRQPLLMALTGTPLVNDVEDFRAIWQLLGWVDETGPRGHLLEELEDAGLSPADPDFYPSARRSVIDLGVVRRRKVDVAADIPARRIADVPVDLDGAAGRSVRAAERALVDRMLERYARALAHRASGLPGAVGDPEDVEAVEAADAPAVPGVDAVLVRRVARAELKDSSSDTGDNVFTVVRRIGEAKAPLAADVAAQLARSAGKVVLFAKHVAVMDEVERSLAAQGLRTVSVRGGQSPAQRQEAVDAFVGDPGVSVAVCSLTAAGVGLNLQVASNVVLAELSWTDAEQTQAIDRVHRIGQSQPVTAWRVIAAQTVDARVAALVDGKAGLAARALDGAEEEPGAVGDVQLEALVALLTEALRAGRGPALPA